MPMLTALRRILIPIVLDRELGVATWTDDVSVDLVVLPQKAIPAGSLPWRQ